MQFISDLATLFLEHYKVLLLLVFYIYVSNYVVTKEYLVKKLKVTMEMRIIFNEGTYIHDLISEEESEWLNKIKLRYFVNIESHPLKDRKGIHSLETDQIQDTLDKYKSGEHKAGGFRIIFAIMFPFILPFIFRCNKDLSRVIKIKEKIFRVDVND